jgi:hypothetical protein
VAAEPPLKPPKAPLGARWLLLPMSIFGLLFVTLVGWAIGGAIRQRRSARRYARLLRYGSSSSSNPS